MPVILQAESSSFDEYTEGQSGSATVSRSVINLLEIALNAHLITLHFKER
ncbi:hypothetical protein HALA3H3_880045 [Halomonas sp. A3H3]|nr:conserved hypothetical protein [Halomonas sp. 156]CAD5290871.1 conserved hypothetical protein [Halomonas sp. 113]CAD5292284.1 conserved hypothetical protein [Halomonas sp. 59]CAD5295945.1 conserved hypothetical protein [Halomonas sp. I3]CDG55228.1 hypothetical protein HALA3H3_880045 [Halomonas sp. A3H3]VXB56022.1 conserved hypothetical protein [Halomonas titanicae]